MLKIIYTGVLQYEHYTACTKSPYLKLPQEIALVKGNQNLANSQNGILELFYHTKTNIKLWDAQVHKSNVVALLPQ